MINAANISAWFADCATRHPLFQHSESNKRFFELEWDQLMAMAKPMAMMDWTLVLEDYVERFRDNGGDYVSILNVISFTVLKHVPRNKAISLKMDTWNEARDIVMGIVGKMKADEQDSCDADLPAGVKAPRLVDLNTLQLIPVEPPYADHAVGIRASVSWRTDEPDIEFTRDMVAWLPLT